MGYNVRVHGYILPGDILQSHGIQVIESSDGGLHQEILRADQLGSDVVAHHLNRVSEIAVSSCP